MRVKLKDAFNLQMGKTPSRADLSMWGGNNKWISIADIGSAKKYISSTKECITDEGVSRSGIKVVPEGTVIMSFKLSIGKTAIVSEDMYTNEAIMAFIDNGTYCIDPNYLYHLCCGTDWTQGGNKAVMGLTLNKATLSEMEIELPTIEEQREIASKLDQLDAIIEKRHDELNMIEQLVKSRFIELIHNNNIRYVKLKDVAEDGRIITYGIVKPGEHTEGGVPIIKVKDFPNGTILMSDMLLASPEIESKYERSRVKEGDLLFSIRGSVGRTAFVPKELIDANITQDTARISVGTDFNPHYIRAALGFDSVQQEINEHVRGVAVRGISLAELRDIGIPIVEKKTQDEFGRFVEQTDKSKFFACQTLSFLLKLANNLQSWREKQYDY